MFSTYAALVKGRECLFVKYISVFSVLFNLELLVFMTVIRDSFGNRTFVGCYKDVRMGEHDLPRRLINKMEVGIIDECTNVCLRNNFRYAGARVYGCYCGNTFGRYGKAESDAQCQAPECSGTLCGAKEFNAIYLVCPLGFFGHICEQECHCQKEPCLGLSGVCPKGGCLEGWIGEKCNKPDPCYKKFVCRNGGTCTANPPFLYYTCICTPGFKGPYCEQTCPWGFYGDDCTSICNCAYNRCDAFTGICPEKKCKPGFAGSRCDIFDPCLARPCVNGGTCYTELDQFYVCLCPTGFYGYNCQYSHAGGRVLQNLTAANANSSVSQPKTMVDEVVLTGTYDYMGCYRDNDRDRDLNLDLWEEKYMGSGPCIRYCQRRGFTYAGVMAGMYCRCGNSFGKHGAVHPVECDIPCHKDTTLKCGAMDLNSVYTVCPLGRYEQTCKSKCNCAFLQCNLLTGICSGGLCKYGWTGTKCNTVSEEDGLKSAKVIARILTATAGIFALAVLGTTVWMLCRFSESKKMESKMETTIPQQNSRHTENAQYGVNGQTEVVLKKEQPDNGQKQQPDNFTDEKVKDLTMDRFKDINARQLGEREDDTSHNPENEQADQKTAAIPKKESTEKLTKQSTENEAIKRTDSSANQSVE